MVAEVDPKHLQHSLALIHPRFQGILKSKHKDHVALVKNVLIEVHKDYEFSIRKAIGQCKRENIAKCYHFIIELLAFVHMCGICFAVDYILKDPDERARVKVKWTPPSFPQHVIRAPIPWHVEYQMAKDYNNLHLFITNPMMQELQVLWYRE